MYLFTIIIFVLSSLWMCLMVLGLVYQAYQNMYGEGKPISFLGSIIVMLVSGYLPAIVMCFMAYYWGKIHS